MAAAALLRMHDRGICHHFRSNLAMIIPNAAVLQRISLPLLWISHGITVVPTTVQVSSPHLMQFFAVSSQATYTAIRFEFEPIHRFILADLLTVHY